MIDFNKAQKKLRFNYPEAQVFAFPDEEAPTEVICEFEPTRQHPEYSIAAAIIEESAPHHHKVTTEMYQVLDGLLDLHIGSRVVRLARGQTEVIQSGVTHWAESTQQAWVRVTSRPGWTKEDHILDNVEIEEE